MKHKKVEVVCFFHLYARSRNPPPYASLKEDSLLNHCAYFCHQSSSATNKCIIQNNHLQQEKRNAIYVFLTLFVLPYHIFHSTCSHQYSHIGLLYQCITAHKTAVSLLFNLTMPLQFCCTSHPHSCCVLVDALWFLFVKADSNKNRNQFLSKPSDLFFMHHRPRKQPLHFLPSAFFHIHSFSFTLCLSLSLLFSLFLPLFLSLTHTHTHTYSVQNKHTFTP